MGKGERSWLQETLLDLDSVPESGHETIRWLVCNLLEFGHRSRAWLCRASQEKSICVCLPTVVNYREVVSSHRAAGVSMMAALNEPSPSEASDRTGGGLLRDKIRGPDPRLCRSMQVKRQLPEEVRGPAVRTRCRRREVP
jgi:hypothetical protein